MDQIADKLNNALYGKMKKEEREQIILDTIMSNNLKKRLDIAHQYLYKFGKPLYEDMREKLSSDFRDLSCQLFLSPLDFVIKHLERAVDKKDDKAIFELITPRNLDELALIQDAYKKDTGNSLRIDLEKIYSKDPMKKNVQNIFTTKRSTVNNPNFSECERCANTLIEQGEKKWVGDENIFRDIFLKKSPEELVIIARYYLKKTGKNLADSIDGKSDLDKLSKTLLRELLYNNIMPHEIAAEKIYLAIKGAGTDENTLFRTLVARFELDMQKIREMYLYKYKVDIKEDIIGDTSGNYQKLCIYLAEK